MRISYRTIKHSVLVVLLATLCFGFGYLYFGNVLTSVLSRSEKNNAHQSGPPPRIAKQIEALNLRIQQNPQDDKAYSELGNLYFQANKFAQALGYYEKAVKLDGKDIIARNDLALCYHIAGRDRDALQELDAAIKISPRAQHLWLTLGLVHYETGKLKEAKQVLEKAYRLDPTSEAGAEAKSLLAAFKPE